MITGKEFVQEEGDILDRIKKNLMAKGYLY
jgi:hypothetical protein